jgi:hypothetical protein
MSRVDIQLPTMYSSPNAIDWFLEKKKKERPVDAEWPFTMEALTKWVKSREASEPLGRTATASCQGEFPMRVFLLVLAAAASCARDCSVRIFVPEHAASFALPFSCIFQCS